MSSVDSDLQFSQKAVITTKMVSEDNFEEHMDEFYDIFIGEDKTELFICKFNNCPNIEKQESDIIEHLRQHFFDVLPNNKVVINLSDKSGESSQAFKREETEERVDSEECLNESTGNNCLANNWEQWVGVQFSDNKQLFFCQFSKECRFQTNLRMKIKTHINKHLEPKVNPKLEFEFWDQCLNFDNQSMDRESMPKHYESTPKTASKHSKNSPKAKSYTKNKTQNRNLNASVVRLPKHSFNDSQYETNESEIPDTSSLIDINFNHNNTILSLKGMASVKKLEKYIQCEVIDGLKYFCCTFANKCNFKSRRSQETANHVHCAHLGFYLECVRPDCDKVFRTPGSWREHQKNHICNFGLYGYQKGVTGKCRNSYLLQFQDKIITEDNHKAYKCIWKGCGFITRQRTACKRHIHNSHVCPYRKNKQWKKELLKFMEIKSHISDKPIPNFNKDHLDNIFHCTRAQCGAQLTNEADLRKHETHFCKFTKSVTNGEKSGTTFMDKSKVVNTINTIIYSPSKASTSGFNVSPKRTEDSNKKIKQKTKKAIYENGYKNTEQKSSNYTQKDEIREKCEKFIERKLYDGINFILCCAPNCKFTTKIEDKIYDHIQKMHSLVNPRFMSSEEHIPQLRSDRKRSHSSLDSNETIVSKRSRSSINSHQFYNESTEKKTQTVKQNTTQRIPQNATRNSTEISSKSRKLSQNLSQNSSDSRNKYKEYYKVKRIESDPNYFCEFPLSQCRFYSKTEDEIIDHINDTHIVFRCDVNNCKREFKSEALLEVHKRNHICGFGIKGMKATGVCSLENVRKYRREVLIDGIYKYECKVCKFQSEVKSLVLSHAHNRHIHPQPPPQ